jgi:hypothetical protein
MRPAIDVEIRFAEKVRVDESGCHIWTGAQGSRGYGTFWTGRKQDRPARYAYEKERGLIPGGMSLTTTCGDPMCVNVEHLALVRASSETRSARPSRTGVHKCGHAYKGGSRCAECKNEQRRKVYGDRAKAPSFKTRAQVYDRCGGYCDCCGSSLLVSEMHVHHRRLRSQGGSNDVSNLLALHDRCHASVHQNPRLSYEMGWLVPSWADPLEYPLTLPDGRQVLLTNESDPVRLGEASGW